MNLILSYLLECCPFIQSEETINSQVKLEAKKLGLMPLKILQAAPQVYNIRAVPVLAVNKQPKDSILPPERTQCPKCDRKTKNLRHFFCYKNPNITEEQHRAFAEHLRQRKALQIESPDKQD